MNLVHEYCSSQKKKKNFKNEIFENKFFFENNILNAKRIALHYRKCKDNVYTLAYGYD